MSTSKLQEYTYKRLKYYFPDIEILENHHPRWLENPDGTLLELDFYLLVLNLAIEVQGEQHFKFTPLFHKDYEDFTKQLKRDEVKRATCLFYEVRLVEICTEDDLKSLIDEIYPESDSFIIDPTNPAPIKIIDKRIEQLKSDRTIISRIRKVRNLQKKIDDPNTPDSVRNRATKIRDEMVARFRKQKLLPLLF